MFVMGRAALNFIDLCGIHKAKAYKNSGDNKLLHAIGFRENNNGEFDINLDGMFDGKCSGHKVEL